MKKIKKVLVLLFVIILCFNYATIDSRADASVSISLSTGSTSIGGSVSVTVSVSGSDISAYDIYVSYDSGVLQYNSGSGSAQANGGGGTVRLVGTGAGSTTLSFSAIGNGTAYISTSGTEVYDINYNQLGISHAGASVTVATPTTDNNNNQNDNQNNNQNDNQDDTSEQTTTEEDDRSANCNLKSLQISPGVLEPAFSPSTTYYSVQVDEDVTSMVVSAVAEDENATTAVRGAGLIEPGANTVTITVTAENGAVKVYTLSVAAGEVLGDAKAVIDGIEYSFIQDSNGLEYPEGYTEITTTYKDWDVLAFESPNKKVVLVCLEPEAENGEESTLEWYIYDKDKESFAPYREYSSEFNRYVIVEAPEGVELPEGFEKTEVDIGGIGERVTAYKSSLIADNNMYLVYAINIAGDEGFYWYDAKEKSFLRYAEIEHIEEEPAVATETVATVAEPEVEETPAKDEGFFTKNNLTYIAIGLAALSLLLLILVVVLGILLKKKKGIDENTENDNIKDELSFNELENNDIITGEKEKQAYVEGTDIDNGNSESEALYKEISEEEMSAPKEVYTEEDAQKAYEEDREIKPVSFNLENMEFNSETSNEEEKQISIMSFKKKDDESDSEASQKKAVKANDNEDIPAESDNLVRFKEAVEEEVKTEGLVSDENSLTESDKTAGALTESETRTEEKSEEEPDEVPLVNINIDRDNRAYEYDYEKQAKVINDKIENGYDANLDSAFADDNDDK
ncbi:MAG: cadherin-like beta sandwich domain-containing protein [Lachnospiraceae bacterium]|nr:cadherin-like beta sandwich domain-containing protein [Lachnospiraceae bacterium]